jgi:hypothetical protein
MPTNPAEPTGWPFADADVGILESSIRPWVGGEKSVGYISKTIRC